MDKFFNTLDDQFDYSQIIQQSKLDSSYLLDYVNRNCIDLDEVGEVVAEQDSNQILQKLSKYVNDRLVEKLQTLGHVWKIRRDQVYEICGPAGEKRYDQWFL